VVKVFLRRDIRAAALVALALTYGCGEKAPSADTSNVAVAPTSAVAAPATAPAAPDTFRVAFETSKGTFTVQINRAWSPLGADRFYELVNSGYFTDVRFFRVVPGFVVQFGMHPDPKLNTTWRDKTIVDDSVTQSNKRGTIVFATRGPNTRANQFFINLADNGSLDAQGFSPLGLVTGDGMSVVDKIYSGYGEAPSQERIGNEGNAYLTKDFPKMDYIKSAKVVGAPVNAATR
jgi:peptidyl-prolyl cis-trans isomerase A (cyclophilin A)